MAWYGDADGRPMKTVGGYIAVGFSNPGQHDQGGQFKGAERRIHCGFYSVEQIARAQDSARECQFAGAHVVTCRSWLTWLI